MPKKRTDVRKLKEVFRLGTTHQNYLIVCLRLFGMPAARTIRHGAPHPVGVPAKQGVREGAKRAIGLFLAHSL